MAVGNPQRNCAGAEECREHPGLDDTMPRSLHNPAPYAPAREQNRTNYPAVDTRILRAALNVNESVEKLDSLVTGFRLL